MLLATSRLKRETIFLCRKHKNGWQKSCNSANFSRVLFQLMLDAWQTVCYNFSLRGSKPRVLPCRQEGRTLFAELSSAHKVVGVKQSTRAVREGRAAKVFLADDADPMLLQPVEALCRQNDVCVVRGATMSQLGTLSGISVGAAVVAVLKHK